jgi:hypothetical protein
VIAVCDSVGGAAEGALAGGLFGAIVEKEHIPKYEQYVGVRRRRMIDTGAACATPGSPPSL